MTVYTYEDAVKMITGAGEQAGRSFAIDPVELGKTFKIGSEPYDDALRIISVPENRLAQAQRQAKEEAERRSVSIEKELHAAAAGMGGAVAGVEYEVVGPIPENTKGLVLPRLTVSDQISDLEKIREGLDENAFDDALTAIVKEEVDGTLKLVAKERAGAGMGQLVSTRNALLKEISARVG